MQTITDTTTTYVLIHGLTFDHRMWDPVIGALPAGRRVLAPDLPGHGRTPMLPEPGLAPVVDAVHEAVRAAGIERPIVVGHSIGGPVAAIYASTYPAAGVISVEAPIRLEPFAAMLAALRPQLEGPGFDQAWGMFQQSWRMDLVPAGRRELLRAGERGSQDVVLSYQADLLDRPLADVVRWRDEGLGRLAQAGIPYVSLHANPVEPADEAWLKTAVPQAEVIVWPVEHHFPHLADPDAFADLLERVAESAASRPELRSATG